MAARILILLGLLAVSFTVGLAFDPSALQDFCVADKTSSGDLEVGFVTSNPENRLITKVLQKGDVFVFPIGLIHYQRNVGSTNVVAIAALSSQNPGVITIGNAVFGSTPEITSDILVKAFQVDKNVVDYIKSKF